MFNPFNRHVECIAEAERLRRHIAELEMKCDTLFQAQFEAKLELEALRNTLHNCLCNLEQEQIKNAAKKSRKKSTVQDSDSCKQE